MVYNRVLAIRKDAWGQEQKHVGYYETKKLLPEWKVEYPSLKNVHSQVLQDVVTRVDKAYKAFFRRVKSGEKPGHPRFKQFGRYDSITYTQSGFELDGQRLVLSKVGAVPIITHRTFEGDAKTCTIRRSSTGKWYASITVDIGEVPVRTIEKPAIGIDLGLTNFVAMSNGELVKSPKFFREDEPILARAQRRLSKQVRGTPERRRSLMIVSKIHEKIANRRSDFAHKLSRDLVDRFGVIVFEDLNTKGMVRNHYLAKSISDVAWNQLVQMTQNKAVEAGSRVVLVDPYNTSQRCSGCGQIVKKELNIRVHQCPFCGLSIDRDINAALNILGLGLQSGACTTSTVHVRCPRIYSWE
jgi:putative transposase